MKTKLKRIGAIALVSFMTVLSTGCEDIFSQQADPCEKGEPVSYATLKMRGVEDGEMPIGGFIGPTDKYTGNGYALPSLINDQVFGYLKECGINNVIDTKIDASKNPEMAETILSYADKYEISWFMQSTAVHDLKRNGTGTVIADVATFAAELKRLADAHPYYAGMYGLDEPANTLYPYIENSWNTVKEARDSLGAGYEDLSIYYNLYPPCPQIGQDENGKTIEYQNYLDGYVATGAEYLQFDMYPIYGETGSTSSWFDLLGRINRTVKNANIPWVGYIQCGGYFYDNNIGTEHRSCNENELNWNVNTMLAFGAKGVSYFPCMFPPEWSAIPNDKAQANSLIDKYGNKTPYWYYAKKINTQIAAIDHVLMNSAHMGVILSGKGEGFYSNAEDSFDSFRQLLSVSGDPALVGCFDYQGGTALYIVNNTFDEHRGEITLTFDRAYECEVIQRGVAGSIVSSEFVVTLEAGEGALVVLK